MLDPTLFRTQNVRQSVSNTFKGGIVQSAITQFNASNRSKTCSVKVVLQGEEHYKVDQNWYTLKENQILLVPAGSSVETRVDSKEVVKGICFYLDFSLFTSTGDLFIEEQGEVDAELRSKHFTEPINITGTSLLKSIKDLNQSNLEEDIDHSLHRFSMHFDQFSKTYTNRVKQIKAQKQSTLSELARRIEMGRQYIHDHFGEKILLDDIAKAAILSPFHFQRAFTSMYQQSPNNYLKNIRIDQARSLILQNQLSKKEIADHCGFSDVSYLNKCLKKTA